METQEMVLYGEMFLEPIEMGGQMPGDLVIGVQGPACPAGPKGDTGIGIEDVARTSGTGAPGTVDTYTIWLTDGTTREFTVYNGANGKDGTGGGGTGADGEDGATFTPYVDANGNLSWSNNKGLANPDTVNIKGDKGDKGDPGYSPVRGTDYWTASDIAEIKSYVDNAILGGAW